MMPERLDQLLEIRAQAEAAKTLPAHIAGAVARAAEVIGAAGPVYIAGCGDSYFAGLAVQPLARKFLGERVQPMPATTFSRYVQGAIEPAATLIAVSMSGKVARTVEAVNAARHRGVKVIAITNNPQSPLAEAADVAIVLGLNEEGGWTPGTLTYFGSLVALYELIFALGGSRALTYRRAYEVALGQVEGVLAAADAGARQIGKVMSLYNTPPFYILGAGPNFATAKYSAAKFFETYAGLAIGNEIEEFAHQEWWVLQKSNPVFVLCVPGPGFSRCVEVLKCAREFGATIVPVTSDPKVAELSPLHFRLPALEGGDLFSPLLYHIPLQLTAYYLTLAKGLDPNDRTHVDPFRKQVSRQLTRGSVILNGDDFDALA